MKQTWERKKWHPIRPGCSTGLVTEPSAFCVFLSFSVPHHLRLGLRVYTLGQTGELQRCHLSRQAKGSGKFALPLSFYRLVCL